MYTNINTDVVMVQVDKDFVWSLWKKLQVTNPDVTQAVGLVVQRYVGHGVSRSL